MSPSRNEDLALFWIIGSLQLVLFVILSPFVFNDPLKRLQDYIGLFLHCFMMVSAVFLFIGLITGRYLLLLPSAAYHAFKAMDFFLHTVYAMCQLPIAFATASTLAETYVGFSYREHIMRHVLDVLVPLLVTVFYLVVAALTYYQATQSEDEEVPRDIEEGNVVCDC